ncbi:MAG: phosphatidylserine/phosphatidylglycerophosphate/cardiolipin synthase family protein [Anaerolineae bacterium]
MTPFSVFFGGPDRPPRLLRDLLEEHVEAVPRGGEILWISYYFRDQALGEALVRARQRGVSVKVVIEGAPRLKTANDAIRRRLEGENGLGHGFRSVVHSVPCHVHEKLYYFSAPSPVAFVGSFNPSGNRPEDPEVIREIGDQDRGHNALVAISDPLIVRGLAAHARWLHEGGHGLLERVSPVINAPLLSDAMRAWFFPRWRSDVLIRLLQSQGSGARLTVVVSHLNDKRVLDTFIGLAKKGASVEVLAHETWRRVPRHVGEALVKGGVGFRRYAHPERLPMHNKFLLLETDHRKQVVFGSMNLTVASRWVNHEIVIITEDEKLFRAFEERWECMVSEPWVRSPLKP